MEKELQAYLKQVGAEWSSPKASDATLYPGNWKEPKPETELDGWIHRGSTLKDPKC